MTLRTQSLSSEFATDATGSAVDMRYCDLAAVHAVSTVTTPSADIFVDADVSVTNNTITRTAHGMRTGLKVAASTDGTLPGGLSATNYWIIVVDTNTVKLASSAANAVAGTAVDITSAAGGGTHTLTPAALSSTSVKVQGSNDNSNWVDISGATANITATGSVLVNVADIGYRWIRPYFTVTTGQISVNTYVTGKERAE